MSKLTLDRILQSQGFGTRKWCSELIAAGEVSIAGKTITDSRVAVETGGLVFKIFDVSWVYREHVYIALNKPADFECSRKASHHPGVLTLLPEQFTRRDVQPVGRLDHDTTAKLLVGVKLHDEPSPLAAVTCRMLAPHQLEIVLEQGKYHQVKRMLAAAGNHCVALRRSQIGGLKLDALGLAEGEWCYLDDAQLALLKPDWFTCNADVPCL